MPGNAINNALRSQDIALIHTAASLKSEPSQLSAFLQTQRQNVVDSITAQKSDTYDKVYGDLQRASDEIRAFHGERTQTAALSSLYDNMYDNQTAYADAVERNNNTYGRKFEMNEWSVNNKRDTLFVYSSLFIALSIFILITVLYKMNIISSSIYYITSTIVIIVFILILINRAVYTDQTRNKRFWNKKNFGGKYGTIPIPSICPTPSCPAPNCPPYTM
jgi:hypothetical protein